MSLNAQTTGESGQQNQRKGTDQTNFNAQTTGGANQQTQRKGTDQTNFNVQTVGGPGLQSQGKGTGPKTKGAETIKGISQQNVGGALSKGINQGTFYGSNKSAGWYPQQPGWNGNNGYYQGSYNDKENEVVIIDPGMYYEKDYKKAGGYGNSGRVTGKAPVKTCFCMMII